MNDRTNAERQARHRAKLRKEQAARDAELRALRKKGEPAELPALRNGSGARYLADARIEDIARTLFETFDGYPENKGRRIAHRWLELIVKQERKTGLTKEPVAVQWNTPAQAKRMVEGRLPRVPSQMGWYVFANWLRGYEHSVIEITVAPIAGGTPLDGAVQTLAALPGVYRIARLDSEGSFGRTPGEKRRQVRALLAVSESALQKQPLGQGGWTSADIAIYDPRVT